MKTHRPSQGTKIHASNKLIEEIKAQAKKRPSSAEVDQGKYKLDVSKMRQQLKLLHRGKKKTERSVSPLKEVNTEPPTPKEDKRIELPLPTVPEK